MELTPSRLEIFFLPTARREFRHDTPVSALLRLYQGGSRAPESVRVNAAIDGSKARARLANGELRVVLPRITERRGAGLIIPVDSDAAPSE